MNKRVIFLIFVGMYTPQMEVEEPNIEEISTLFTSKDKFVSEVEVVSRDYLTPKEYGICKLGKKRP